MRKNKHGWAEGWKDIGLEEKDEGPRDGVSGIRNEAQELGKT